jgi:hypothetical protein
MHRIVRFVALYVLVLCSAIQVVAHPIVGLANNGDFARMMIPSGLAFLSDNKTQTHLNYVNRTFAIVEPRLVEEPYISSQLVLIRAAMVVNQVLTNNTVFDLTYLGIIHLLLFTFGIWAILRGAESFLPIHAYIVLAVLLVWIYSDVGYVAFFNSLYSEAGSLVFLSLTIGMALLTLTQKRGRHLTFAAYCLFALLLINAKSQNVLFAPLLAQLGARLVPSKFTWHKLGISAVLCCSAVAFVTTPEFVQRANLYSSVFMGVLQSSPQPEYDLAKLNLPQTYTKYIHVGYWSDESPADDPHFVNSFYNQVNLGTILKFYAAHPERLIRLIHSVLPQVFVTRYTYLGNFENTAETPVQMWSTRFNGWSSFRQIVFPRVVPLLLGGFVAFILTGLAYRLRTMEYASNVRTELAIGLALAALCQFLTAIIGEGIHEASKHLFMFNVIFDACIIVAIVTIVVAVPRILHKSSGLLNKTV